MTADVTSDLGTISDESVDVHGGGGKSDDGDGGESEEELESRHCERRRETRRAQDGHTDIFSKVSG